VTTDSERTGRVALVTAAGDDIGHAVAVALARAGHHVAVHTANGNAEGTAEGSAADAVADEIRGQVQGLGVEVATVHGNVASFDGCAGIVGEVVDRLGPVDVLVHDAGIRPHHSVVELPVEEWHHVFDVNCSSFFYLAKLLLPAMTDRGFGRLIGLTTALGDRALPEHATTAVARVALHELVKVVAVESGAAGVTANVVSHAFVETSRAELLEPAMLQRFLAIPRPAALGEIVAACTYLASDEGGYVTGQAIHVDGGYTI
jgi:NAD(P)-dependent dehydrogenase (short-subunit alcohol dehydrogenase family)